MASKFGPTWANNFDRSRKHMFDAGNRNRTNVCRNRQILPQIQSDVDQIRLASPKSEMTKLRSTSGTRWPNCAEFGRHRPHVVELGKPSAEIGPNLVKFGRNRKRLDKFGQKRRNSGQILQRTSNSGHVWPKRLVESAQSMTMLPDG